MAASDPTTAPAGLWHVALDTGGTFTDLVAMDPKRRLVRVKIPSDGSLLAVASGADATGLRIRLLGDVAFDRVRFTGWRLVAPTGARAITSDLPDGPAERRLGLEDHLDGRLRVAPGDRLRLVAGTRPIDAPRLAMHLATGTPFDRTLPPIEMRLSTTRGTNALLEGKGARVGVLVSDGLTGVVEIGDQTRSDLFARAPAPRRRLAHAVHALPERTLADGSVDRRATAVEVDVAVRALRAEGCERLVVSLAHALVDDGRERAMAASIGRSGTPAVAASTVAAHPRLLTRTETAVVAERIAPSLEAFVGDARASAPAEHRAFVFTSAAVLQSAERFSPADTLFSGPAGGANAVRAIAARHRLRRAIGFDMGGTSTDVVRVDHGRIALRRETRLAGATVAAPALAIESVAAGGGSVCRARDGAFEVLAESAGASPGPACYGRGGPLTITDLNLLAGRLAPESRALVLDRPAAERALAEVAEGRAAAPDEAIAALLEIADARMALAIENLCVRDGIDPRSAGADARDGDGAHALVAFGGAGGQHACSVAERLGLERIVFPLAAGFLSAQGVLTARPARIATLPVLRPLDGGSGPLDDTRAAAERTACEALRRDGFDAPARIEASVALRLVGQDASIEVAFDAPEAMAAAFVARFRTLFGYEPPARAIEIESVRVEATADVSIGDVDSRGDASELPSDSRSTSTRSIRMLSRGRWHEAPHLEREALRPGDVVRGPALVAGLGETVVLDDGWIARIDESGDFVATLKGPRDSPGTSSAGAELFAARLESIALGMGHVLERTALSPNVRDRLDFSCAILDADGTLVQNAPHLPVHLGALGACTRAVAAAVELADGDVAVTNHPAFGGSHLPDVTTVAPVVVDGQRVAFVAVRAHHAEIGGTRPGSFPPDARSLAEEGVVLAPFLAVRGGVLDRDGCRRRFAGGPHPSRHPDENLADLEAQVAATRHGVAKVRELAEELGSERAGPRRRFADRCADELDRAERALRRKLASAAHGRLARPIEVRRALDDGAPIAARIAVDRGPAAPRLSISFAGSAPVHRRNFNAPLAVTRAATLYALRLLVDEPIPMNEGLLRAIDLEVPAGILNPGFVADPTRCPPVVAGNVETSQAVVAALVEAFGLSAESQSTMNNVLFGNDGFTIYETLGGGAGASADADGADAVHVHMSNTRLTDVDVLERRAPVIIRRFEIRRGSGGRGARHGGDGLVRSYEFRTPVELSFFASRRAQPPRGAEGGADGAPGRQRIDAAGHERENADSVLSLALAAGDRFTVETPGGGGWGAVDL